MKNIELMKDIPTVNAKRVHEELKVKTPYTMWIGRLIQKYAFIEKEDFITILLKNNRVDGRGRPTKEYHITIGMAKELCMLDNSDRGRKTRKSYIKLEELYKKEFAEKFATRAISKEQRKELTNIVQDSGENERMHGRGYSSYTRFVYKLTALTEKYNKYTKANGKDGKFRESLKTEELKRIKNIESMVKSLLDMGKQYMEIKDLLMPILDKKELNHE